MKIGFLQFACSLGDKDYNLDQVRRMTENLDVDLLVLPELFNTGYLFTHKTQMTPLAEEIPDGRTTNFLAEIALKLGAFIVAGVMEKQGDLYYNSAVLVDKDGYIDHYRKIHLFNEEKIIFEPGDKPFQVYDLGIARVGIMICYDWIYPESMRVLALKGADIICHCANLVMPYCPGVMPSRCFDNRVFAVTANRCGADAREDKSFSFIGRSMILDNMGKVLKEAGADSEETVIVDINPQDARSKRINGYNDLWRDRRPEFYGDIANL